MGNINEIVYEAFSHSNTDELKINPELTIKAATLDAAWAKHGLGSDSSSHLICGEEEYDADEMREAFENLLFIEATDSSKLGLHGKWRTSFMSASRNIFIARLDLGEMVTDFRAVLGAAKIEEIPEKTLCVVERLGSHPTLICQGDFKPTSEITAIIELDGSLDEDLGDCRSMLKGEPVLVTWFPGRQLPTNNPVDCKVADILTAAEAKAKGWNTVSFKKY